MLMLQEVEGGVRGFPGSGSFRNAHMCNVNEHCVVLITGFRISLQSITSSVRSSTNTEKLQLVARVCVQKLLKSVKLSSPVKVPLYFRCILKCHRKAERPRLSVSQFDKWFKLTPFSVRMSHNSLCVMVETRQMGF